MSTVLRDEIRTARKTYNCDAYARWVDCMSIADCANSEERLILEAAEVDKGRILPGQKYRIVVGIWDGDLGTWRERVGMGSLCTKHGLYDDDC